MKDPNDDKTGELQISRSVGRPRVYTDAAERQRAYRARLKERGQRVITRIVTDTRDDSQPLRSEIIDLSAVRSWPTRNSD